jgi:hypothetical protein
MYDLKSELLEEPGLPDQFHVCQPHLLEDTFIPPGYSRNETFVASDLNAFGYK